ncbi:MAG: lipoprotein-releasing system ATP-binding protein LolD [Candidatus Cloacimonetes bacterium HGW-Cloacimonetes-2]|jgi:lipoprotein-releasing system ATP-binding protein|nr:MAG: lipoprotein-releasing system ATP-binding protein LolD [Candidatus Cloacimonetes bacterium HGW-Cloacimonetes-2]
MHILEARSLVKTYQDSLQKIEVLKGASITIDEAALISITGKSGSGKSTLLHILGLLDSPDKGELLYLGAPVSSSSKNAPQLRNKELGFVFQFHYLIDDLSAEENVALPLMIDGQSKAMSLSRARELLKSFGLEDRQKHYLNQLSGGEQQRVSLARALANHPRLVLADEPTGNLDPENSQEIWQTILKLNREQGQAFVIITHDKDSAGLAKSSYSLQNGVLVPQ